MTPEPLRFAIVGHTNAGKTSLLRTLTRNVDFGEVSDRPGTTRHAETIDLRLDGRVAVRFVDTPGLEDSVALLDYMQTLSAETRPERVRAFLAGPRDLRDRPVGEAVVVEVFVWQRPLGAHPVEAHQPGLLDLLQ